jgi:hypothetical protein
MPTQDLSTQSAADWLQAQTRFQNGLNLGLSEADSAALYLAPIQAKWKIISSAPDEFSDSDKLGKINSDFESAQTSAVKALLGGSLPISLNTTEGKWATMPKSPSVLEQIRDLRLQKLLHPNVKPSVSQQAELAAAKSNYIDKLKNGTDEEKLAARTLLDQISQSMELGGGTETATDSTDNQPASALNPTPPIQSPQPVSGNGTDTLSAPVGELTMPAPAPFYDWLAEKTAESQPAVAALKPTGKFFISGTNGKPDLTNYTDRAEADAAWALSHPDMMNKPAPKATLTTAKTDENLPETVNEVIRLTKDGRKAVFNADTKKFIRYAD